MTFFEQVEKEIQNFGLSISSFDFNRPWGGFFVIDEDQAQKFSNVYFNGRNIEDLKLSGKLSPKLLIVKPDARLSWQYHSRRAEIWKIITGPVGIVRSDNDKENDVEHFQSGVIVTLAQGERHRLIGLNCWGVVAEFWQHTDPSNPSNEEDIVRLQDDYSRK